MSLKFSIKDVSKGTPPPPLPPDIITETLDPKNQVRIHASVLLATSDKALARAHLQSWCFTVCALKR